MKRTNIPRTSRRSRPILTALILGMFAGAVSYAQKPDSADGDTCILPETGAKCTGLPFEIKTVKACHNTPSLKCDVEIDFPVSGKEPLLNGTRTLILNVFGIKEQTSLDNPQDIAQKAVTTVFEERGLAEEFEQEAENDVSAACEVSNSVKLDYWTGKFVTFLIKKHEHMSETEFAYHSTIDAKTGKTLEWNDLFASSVRKRLKKIVYVHILCNYYTM